MSYRVFISYRRDDQPALAHWLCDQLAAELFADEVFLDREVLEGGDDFPGHIEHAIESAAVFIALIGSRWNSVLPDGGRRLDDPRDFVRREVESALAHLSPDPRRLLLPVLFDNGALPTASELPISLHALLKYHAVTIPSGSTYGDGLRDSVKRVTHWLNQSDATPTEEKWILERVTYELLPLNRHLIARIGRALHERFPGSDAPPASVRALAAKIYRTGPAALECLLALGEPGERIGTLIKLLATHWIKPDTARTLRVTLQDEQAMPRVAVECDYADFTPDECLIKASHQQSGWPTIRVEPADPAREIVEQVHEELARRFHDRLRPVKTKRAGQAPMAPELRRTREREAICELLRQQRSEQGRDLPVVLYSDHKMALDTDLFVALHQAFPPLRILVATHDIGELKVHGTFSAVVQPSDSEQQEKDAYEAYADARRLIESTRKARP